MPNANYPRSVIDIVTILGILSKDVPYDIFNYVVSSGPVTRKQICQHLKLDSDLIQTKLNVLVRHHLIAFTNGSYTSTARGNMIYKRIVDFIKKNSVELLVPNKLNL